MPTTEVILETGIGVEILGTAEEILEIMSTHTAEYMIACVLPARSLNENPQTLHLKNRAIIGVSTR